MEKNCNNCALPSLYGGLCPVFRAPMTSNRGCPKHTSQIIYCESCGQPIIGASYLVEENGTYHQTCERCGSASGCHICQQGGKCAFQSDTSCSLPHVVMIQQQQGNMIIQQQVRNPDRIKATCASGCPCYYEDEEGPLCQQIHCGTCNNLIIKWKENS